MTNAVIPGFESMKIIPATKLRRSLRALPDGPGVYLWFVVGGSHLLEATKYTVPRGREILTYRGHPHLYTGAANNLRFRVSQHFRNESHENSSPRKTLMTFQRIFGAMTPISGKHNIDNPSGLTDWLYDNVFLGIERTPEPFQREGIILGSVASPFNMAGRRTDRYSKHLMAWRIAAFPPRWMSEISFSSDEAADPAAAVKARQMSAAMLVR